MNKNADLWYLEGAKLQVFFCPIAISEMADHPAPKTIKRGEFIYFPNDNSNKIYFIEKGRIKIGAYSDDGREIIKAILQKNEIFGELGLIGEQKRNEFAQAMEETTLCVLPIEITRALMEKNKEFSIQITQIIGNKLLRTQRRLESLVFKDARSRVIEFLHDLGSEYGKRIGYEMLVRKFYTHQEIASITGTSRQTVTTILNELRKKNYIYFDRKKLLIRDMKQLKAAITA
ncbi:MAG: Crp/Fnr family transcriptional regulator [Chitinophagales bacterium]